MQLSYLDFELEIGIGQGRDFPVVARSPAGEARTVMRFPFDELAMESRLKDLQIALLRSGGKRRQMLLPEQQAVRDFGQALFDALFTGEVRNRYDVSLQQARSQGKGLRIRLQAQSPTAAALPWEYLYDPRQSEYCALSVETPLVRFLELPQPITPLAVAPPLRMLGMVASPADLPGLDVSQEKQRIEQALQGLRTAGRLEVEWLAGQTWRDLHEALRHGPWHIFHFSGHGRFDVLTDEGQLIFADDLGRAHAMSASNVGRLLANHRTLRLAWLNACEGARGGEVDIFSSAASILVRRGVPAVVAMQHEITDRAAIELARTFYGALADGYPVDAALAEARVATSLAVNNTVEWGTPVLYMRAPDGVLFDLPIPANVGLVPVERSTPNDVKAVPAPGPVQALSQGEAPTTASVEPISEPRFPAIVQRTRQRSFGRSLLAIVVAGIVIAAIILIVNRSRLFPEISGTSVSNTVVALTPNNPGVLQGVDTTAEATTAASAVSSTRTPVSTTLPSKVVITEDGAAVIEPFYMELVRVPTGEFLMGSDRTTDSLSSVMEVPQHRVTMTEFYIGRYEVTNEQYAAFVKATGHDAPYQWENGGMPVGQKDHPVNNVFWEDAVAFTKWLSEVTGKTFRLPSEAEWEKACRGPSGLVYPWGDEFDASRANTVEAGLEATTMVGAYSPKGDSPYAAADMAGNVWEWTSSLYGNYPYDPIDGREDMSASGWRILRGGSFDYGVLRNVRCANRYRSLQHSRDRGFGFRVAMDWTIEPTSSIIDATSVVATTEVPTPSIQSGKIVFSDQGAIITDPIYMELVRVPAGEFLMGSDPAKDPNASDDEKPQHPVSLAEYFIGKYEVTNQQYAGFVEATGRSASDHWESGAIPTGKEEHPVVNVSWDDAVAFADWLSSETGAAFRLPSEAEWEKACRGSNGLIYPWGDSTPDAGKLNYAGSIVGDTLPVGSYIRRSPYGVADMAGNVWEWVADWYGADYYAGSPIENPQGPEVGDRRVVRGGSFINDARLVRCAFRNSNLPNNRAWSYGFRVVVASP